MYPADGVLADAEHSRTLTEWMLMKEGVHPPFRDAALFRPNRPVLVRACALLDIAPPVEARDTKAALVARLRAHALTEAQREELMAFRRRRDDARIEHNVARYRDWQLRKLAGGGGGGARRPRDGTRVGADGRDARDCD